MVRVATYWGVGLGLSLGFLLLRESSWRGGVQLHTLMETVATVLNYRFANGEFAGRDPADHPTLMLLDLKLPKIDGLEALRRVRADERTKLMPVVILTSSDEQKDMIDSYGLGANSYVRKPVDFDEFRDAVHQLHLYWILLNEPPPSSR